MNVGYCTNIHRGTTFSDVIANLERFALPVKQRISADQPMGIGLWFSATALKQVFEAGNRNRLADFLDQNGLVAHTFNAFPYGDFHEAVVKHRVYQPDWSLPTRMEYTLAVAELLSELLPAGSHGSLSTLPLGWPPPGGFQQDSESSRESARNLLACADRLARIRMETDTDIVLCIEPEPGCSLGTAADVVRFFRQHLSSDETPDSVVRRHLGVCHDICHSAVMFESQQDVLSGYESAGIRIGKVQISSALATRLGDGQADLDRIAELNGFVEARYLHQTTCREANGTMHFFDDLPEALQHHHRHPLHGQWRTHFHVPILMERIGLLETTRSEIVDCLDWFVSRQYASQFEVETYAWEVSPDSVRSGSMADSIAGELQWLESVCPQLGHLNRVSSSG